MGRVLARTGDSFRELPLLGLAIAGLFVSAPEALAGLILSQQSESAAQMSESGLNIVLGLVGLIGKTALVHAALQRQLGKSVTIGSSVSAGASLFLPMWGLSILTSLGIALGLILLVIPGLYLLTIWVVAVPARIMDGPGVSAAMGASNELTRGVRWQVFALLLIAGLVFGGAAVGAALGSEYLQGSLKLIGTVAVSPLISGLVTLVFAFGSAALYHELKWGGERGPAETTAELFS
ncbi:MAG: hypothetical protein JWR84_706 [Caulobacter sp.]|nr:hypothetical protein [Caulobacter sp.]